MKKTILTVALLLGITFCSFAQGGLFKYGAVSDEDFYGAAHYYESPLRYNDNLPVLPGHGYTDNQNAPIGSGIFLLIGLGAGYAIRKRKVGAR